MVKEIMRDPFFLAQKSVPATKDDLQAGRLRSPSMRSTIATVLSYDGATDAHYENI